MNNPFQKRPSPFEKKITTENEPVIEQENRNIAKVESEPVYEPVYTAPRPQKVVQRPTPMYNPAANAVIRDKYTSTMDRNLRRRIKIHCATRGILFAAFVEEACKEKIDREGGY